jgi:hypothetical protein
MLIRLEKSREQILRETSKSKTTLIHSVLGLLLVRLAQKKGQVGTDIHGWASLSLKRSRFKSYVASVPTKFLLRILAGSI